MRSILLIGAWMVMLVASRDVRAQAFRDTTLIAHDDIDYTVSFYRQFPWRSDVAELDSVCGNPEAAKRRAQSLLQWSTDDGTRIAARVVIEWEDSKGKKLVEEFKQREKIEVPNPVAVSDGRLNIPAPDRGQGTGVFGPGMRNGGKRAHDGIDIAAPVGTAVQAIMDGVVIKNEKPLIASSVNARTEPVSQKSRDAGNHVVIDHGKGLTSHYFHLDGRDMPVKGAKVVAGQIIGHVGRTGNVPPNADPHLHFEVRRKGEPMGPVLPKPRQDSQD